MILLSWEFPAHSEGISFIVNIDSPIKELEANELSDIFLKKKREWPNGTSIRFVDHIDGSPEREEFTSEILNRTERDLELYWIGQKLYSGNAAPMQVSTDQSVESFVSAFKGAIGYVASSYALGKGAKKITIKGKSTP